MPRHGVSELLGRSRVLSKWVYNSGLRLFGLGFRVLGSGLGFVGLGLGVQGFEFSVVGIIIGIPGVLMCIIEARCMLGKCLWPSK